MYVCMSGNMPDAYVEKVVDLWLTISVMVYAMPFALSGLCKPF